MRTEESTCSCSFVTHEGQEVDSSVRIGSPRNDKSWSAFVYSFLLES